MKLSLSKPSKDFGPQSTLVVFVPSQGDSTKSKKPTPLAVSDLNSELTQLLRDAVGEKSFLGGEKETCFFRSCNVGGVKNLLAIGLGDKAKITPETLRVAGAVAFQTLNGAKVTKAHFHLASALFGQKDAALAAQALGEGLWLSDYKLEELKSGDKEKPKETPKFSEAIFVPGAKTNSAALAKAVAAAEILGAVVNTCRRFGDLPANFMTPEILADETVKFAKGTKVKVTAWDKARIKKERMGGLLGVSQGSGHDPRFIILEYNGGGKSKKPIVFVGKGLTFDSGGISIKPSLQMDDMRYDMCGGANVIGTVIAIAQLGLKLNVVGLVPATENMPGPVATKPGDVLTFRNGKTVEVLNTDAEGRLILADALAYATELKPAAIIDAATLTGAIVMALGNTHTGVFTRNKKLSQQILDAAETSGELVWLMPIHDFHVSDMKGAFADLSNISSFKGAGSATAAAFLEQFVGSDIPWAHFDVAGTAWSIGSRFPYCPKQGASGIMIRTFVELAKDL